MGQDTTTKWTGRTAPVKRAGGQTGRTWRTEKSGVKRQQIIDATCACFLTIGYHRTTVTEIARTAGVTRGAIQYYFPTLDDVLRAAIRYLNVEWLRRFSAAVQPKNTANDIIASGIALAWAAQRDPLHIAWQRLQMAAQTDLTLGELIDSLLPELETARRQSSRDAYPELSAIDLRDFDLANDFTVTFLEGLTMLSFAGDDAARKAELTALLAAFLTEFWRKRGAAGVLADGPVAAR